MGGRQIASDSVGRREMGSDRWRKRGLVAERWGIADREVGNGREKGVINGEGGGQ